MIRLSSSPDLRKYFLYALLIKGVFFVLFTILFHRGNKIPKNENYIFIYSRDYKSYITPSINLVDNGQYYEDDKEKKLFAHKMPGMAPVFVPLYYLFGKSLGLTALVILQFLLDALCCVLLGVIATKLIKDTRAFYIAFFVYTLSTTVSIGTHHAVSEFFCTSFFILCLYYLMKADSIKDYMIAGVFAAWSVFFRPTSILILFFMSLFLFLDKQNRFSFKALIGNRFKVVLFLLPFLILESAWMFRNYRLLNRIIPAEISAENFGTPAMRSIFSMILAFGGDLQSWNEDSEMLWFNGDNDPYYKDPNSRSKNPFPYYLQKAGISMADFQVIKDKYTEYGDTNITALRKIELQQQITALTDDVKLRFRENAPLYYHLVAPLRTLQKLVLIKRPYGFSFPENTLIEKLVRIWHFLSYYIPLLLFLVSFVWIFKQKYRKTLILFLLAAAHTLLYGFVLRYTENRYLVPVYPCFVVIATGTILFFFSRKNSDNNNLTHLSNE